jgi:hypothetical protein
MAGTTNNFTVRVADNGAPPLSDARTFTVVVASRPALRVTNGASAGSVTLTWNAIAGKTYRIQYKGNLNEIAWNDLGPGVTANGSTVTIEDTPGTNQRFYRIAVDG